MRRRALAWCGGRKRVTSDSSHVTGLSAAQGCSSSRQFGATVNFILIFWVYILSALCVVDHALPQNKAKTNNIKLKKKKKETNTAKR